MGLAAAVIGGSVIGAIGTSMGASKAASAQTKAADQANATQREFFGQSKEALNPYIQGGTKAYGTLNDLLGVGGNSATMQSTLEGLPGYQFTRDQGLKSTQSGYAARGLADSGGALKGAANYVTGLANNQYGNYVGQLQNSANTGASAASALAGYGTQTGQGIASNQIGAGNAQAAAANATGGAVSGAANNIGQFYTLKNILGANGSNTPYDSSSADSIINYFGGT
jgi:hypothetical protein